MITRITAAVVAAFVVSGSSGAFAAAMDHDPTTGLNTYYHYGPISELSKRGLPLKEGASKYISAPQGAAKQGAPAKQGAARKQSTPVYLLEDRGAAPARGTAPLAPAGNVNDKASGHLW